MSNQFAKNPQRVLGGLKATIHNPNVSSEAKERAATRLRDLEAINTPSVSSDPNTVDPADIGADGEKELKTRRLGGYKATLKNTSTSDSAKGHAREVLEAAGYQVAKPELSPEEQHETRVIAGYKAALHNPRVSEAAKQTAKEFLEARGAV